MAKNSVIGALRVELGLDSAQFHKGLQGAQDGLAKFGKMAGLGLAAAAAAATAASVALGLATKNALQHADALGKAAQKSGTTVEALSRLEYAAKLSDVSLEQLSGGLQKLSRTMVDVATGGGEQAKVAFHALGISLKDAEGKMLSSDAVFAQIADRFSRMEDGVAKTAIATLFFGRAGADLIPLLNAGAGGLRNMGAEADRLGITVSGKTSKAAEKFNDALTTVQTQLGAVGNQIVEKITPQLVSIAETLTSPGMQQAINGFVGLIAKAVGGIVGMVDGALKGLAGLAGALNDPGKDVPTGESLKKWFPTRYADAADNIYRQFEWRQNRGLNVNESADSLYSGFNFGKDGKMMVDGMTMPDITVDTDKLLANLERANEGLKKNGWAWDDIKKKMKEAAADAAEAARMQQEGLLRAASSIASTLGNIGSLIEQTGEENFAASKAFAVAGAVVSGIAGVAAAVADGWKYGPIVAGLQGAAAATAAATNIASLLATTSSSTSMSGGAGSVPSVAAPQQSAGTTINLELRGNTYSRDQVEGLIRDLVEAQGDGFRLVTT